MDLDERQQFTHAARTLVELADIFRREIQQKEFSESQAEAMLLVYWRVLIHNTFTPDIGDIMKKFMPGRDDD